MTLNKTLIFSLFLTFIAIFVSCEDDSASSSSLRDFVGVEEAKNVGIVLGETVVVESKIYASESVSIDRTFDLIVDPSSTHAQADFVVPASVTIPAGSKEGVFQVSLTGNNIDNEGNLLVLSLSELSGVNQSSTGTNPVVSKPKKKIVYNISEVCQTGLTKVQLSIKFDNFPEETAWELYDSSFNVVASGGFTGTTITGYAALGFADQDTFISNFCLAPGTYTFVIYDDYGDGMYTNATISGNYSLKFLDGTVLASGGGDFGAFEDTEFTIQ
ncbi:MAG: hypothetical protein O9282_07340 [Flavobacterium sp.]|jgi:hypothetical protein|uniref:hypothetical protein n=1 Tax=Flavobacterium sp. TaxID=239 RepID=UPI0022C275B1|nr:hypothetical protein [Flavobacterium sp.]MCZ8331106.1 hypothetical protein [Flavobacterium sp.]